MAKISLSTIVSGFNLSNIQANFAALANHLNNKVLYRDNPSGEANAMQNDFDMNSNRILNLPLTPTNNTDAVSKAYVDGQDTKTTKSYEMSTSDATATEIYTQTVSLNSVGFIRATVVGVEDDAATPERAVYVIEAGFYRGNTGSPAFTGTDPNALKSEQSAGTPSVALDFNGNDLRIRVTGVAATNMSWDAYVELNYDN